MLRYNLSAAFRYIKRNLSFSLINISGLALGLTLVIILLLWIDYELSFDRFHEKADRIFRVVAEFQEEKGSDNFAHTPAPLGDAIMNDIPEVSDFVRFSSLNKVIINYGDGQYWENIELADPSIFRIFSFRLVSGNSETALDNPNSIIISETKAKKYFGSANPMGRTLYIGDQMVPHTITGVMKDIPVNSQMQFDFLCSFSKIRSKGNLSWGSWNYNTYILAKDKNMSRIIDNKLSEVLKKHSSGWEGIRLHIQPLTRIHLHSDLRSDLPTNRNIKTIYIIGSICLLVLIIACINYMNLATARYTRRGKEAGLRKVTGATNANLTGQFLSESFAITFSALLIALFLSSLTIPVFASLTGIPLAKESLFDFSSLVKFIILIIFLSVISGSYPAFMLSSVNPVSALRDDFKLGKTISIKGLRKGLVIIQFFISIVLIASTLIIRSQMSFIKKKDLGIDPEQIVVVPIYQAAVKPKYELFKSELMENPLVLNASAVSYFPGFQGWKQNAWWEGLQKDDNSNMMSWLPVDQDFINTLKIEMIKGENFPLEITGDTLRSYILNESAAKIIGWDEPLGKQFEIRGIDRKGKVIGVVKDFNYKSLHYEIDPIVLIIYPSLFDNLMVKVSSSNIQGTLDFIKAKWQSLFPGLPFEYSFLRDDFQKLYKKETMTLKLVTLISIMALFISCIGLFGLVLFTIDRRIKEIGLRKVAGSTSGRIILMLNKEFISWIIVSFILSCPIIIYFMQKWLNNFAFRISLSWWIFLLALLITVIISLLTVSWHTWHTASRNPAECLRQN